MTIAFVYPGQGAQTIGMGRDLADAYPAAKTQMGRKPSLQMRGLVMRKTKTVAGPVYTP